MLRPFRVRHGPTSNRNVVIRDRRRWEGPTDDDWCPANLGVDGDAHAFEYLRLTKDTGLLVYLGFVVDIGFPKDASMGTNEGLLTDGR